MNNNQRFDSDIRGRRYKNKQFRKVISNFPSQFYFADLIDWTKKEGITNSTFVNSNNGYQYILIVVDGGSPYYPFCTLSNCLHVCSTNQLSYYIPIPTCTFSGNFLFLRNQLFLQQWLKTIYNIPHNL